MNNKTLYIIGGLVVAALLVVILSHKSQSTAPSTAPQSTVGVIGNLQEGNPPWPVEFDHLRQRLASIGLPALTEEGTVLHTHQHLDISVNGTAVPVPSDIGIDQEGQFISPIHVHDLSGIIHVESPTVQTYTLGQFFDIWGLTFTNQCIGGECANESQTLRVYVNGALYQGDPRSLALAAHQEIFIFYGTADQLPKKIPSSYVFPAGY